jgi:integrase
MLRHGVCLDRIALVLRHRVSTRRRTRQSDVHSHEQTDAEHLIVGEASFCIDAIERYLSLRRTAGFDLSNAAYLLASFARFAAERNEMHIRTQTAIDWAVQGPSVAQRDARLKTICRFARHIRVEDGRHELPPANHFGYRKKRRVPYIYSSSEINRLIEAAVQLETSGALRSRTYATLLALLASTGLRSPSAGPTICRYHS